MIMRIGRAGYVSAAAANAVADNAQHVSAAAQSQRLSITDLAILRAIIPTLAPRLALPGGEGLCIPRDRRYRASAPLRSPLPRGVGVGLRAHVRLCQGPRGENGNSRAMARAVRAAPACKPMRALPGRDKFSTLLIVINYPMLNNHRLHPLPHLAAVTGTIILQSVEQNERRVEFARTRGMCGTMAEDATLIKSANITPQQEFRIAHGRCPA